MPWQIYFIASVFVVLNRVSSGDNQTVCGKPGKPFMGDLTTPKLQFMYGENVGYSCPKGWILGDHFRKCGENGRWTGSVPVCLRPKNILLTLNAMSSSFVHIRKEEFEGNVHLLLDDTHKGCLSLSCDDLTIWFAFAAHWNLEGLKLVFNTFGRPTDYPSLKAFSEHEGKNRTTCISSISGRGRNDQQDGLYVDVSVNCSSMTPSRGVTITFNNPKYMNLCKVEFYVRREDSKCGQPDVPLHGGIKQKDDFANTSYIYYCEPDFDLVGNTETVCNKNGTWSLMAPSCDQKTEETEEKKDKKKEKKERTGIRVRSFVLGSALGAAFVLFLFGITTLICVYKRKRRTKLRRRDRLNHSSQRSNSFEISYRRNRQEKVSSVRYSTWSEADFNPNDESQPERPRSDVPDILGNGLPNNIHLKRDPIVSAHIYAEPDNSSMDYGQVAPQPTMVDNVLYCENT